jgi:hypothetical protein
VKRHGEKKKERKTSKTTAEPQQGPPEKKCKNEKRISSGFARALGSQH